MKKLLDVWVTDSFGDRHLGIKPWMFWLQLHSAQRLDNGF